MSLCINPNCPYPENSDHVLFCQACGSELLLVGRYQVNRLLSRKGGFGRTYEVSQDSTPKVLKVLIKQDEPRAIELFQQEARVLQQLNHPGIPKGDEYFTYFARKSEQPLHCLVMERIEGLDLEEYQQQRQYRPIEQKLALEWLLQLAEILQVVHQQQFFHRDIKPSNIILRADGQLVLIDFGSARAITSTYWEKQPAGQVTAIASFGYSAPEQLNNQAVLQSDFFALGRTFVFLLTGQQPTAPGIYDPQNDQLNWRSHTPNILPELADFIDELMMRLASQRPADTQVILQRLAEIEQILNGTSLPTQLGKPKLKRRQLIKVAGLGVAGLVGGVIVYRALTSSKIRIDWNNLPPPLPGKELQDFDFEVVTLDSQGKENSRNPRQAKFFTEDLGEGILLEMVAIPGGSFIMGSPDTEEERSPQENPQHSVTIKPFYLGKFTITQAQWRAVAALDKVNRNLNADPSNFKGDNLPVERVSWYDAQEFCARLSKKTGHTYQLPSEAQWEYACRAGTTTPFHFGKTITTLVVNYNGKYTYGSAPKGEYRHKTTTVGSFRVPNAFGLSNMHGNVWEWCEDRWHDNYNGAPMDGSAWIAENESDNRSRLLRGGSWHDKPKNCRSAYRVYYEPGFRNLNVGFRVVCR